MSSVSRGLAGVTAVLAAVVAALVAAVVAAALTGCAATGVPYKTPSSAASSAAAAPTTAAPAPTVSMTPVPAASGQLTGTQLETVLLPQSFFPAGFTLSSSSVVSSGSVLSSSPARYDVATVDCATFVNHFGNTGFGETALASVSAVGSSQAFDQVVYQFGSPAAAAAFVSKVASLAGRCGSFTATSNGATGTFSLKAVPGPLVGGHSSVALTQAGVLNHAPLTIDTVLSASGVDVFAGAAVGLGAAAPASVAPATIAYSLMKRQAAAAVLGSS